MKSLVSILLTDLTDPDMGFLLSRGEEPQSVHIMHGYHPNESVKFGLELIVTALLKMIREDQFRVTPAVKVIVEEDTVLPLDSSTLVLNLYYSNRNKVLSMTLSDDKALLYLH